MNPMVKVAFAAALALIAGAAAAAEPLDLGFFAGARLLMPDGPATASVFLLSDAGGLSEADDRAAEALRAHGAAVIAVDAGALTRTIEAAATDCVYLVADIERVSHEIGRRSGASVFLAPVIAGRGAGGALALDILAQTPVATVGAVVAVDPTPRGEPSHALCTGTGPRTSAEGPVYDLPAGVQAASLSVILSSDAPGEGGVEMAALKADRAAYAFARDPAQAPAALAHGVDAALAALGRQAETLPLAELPATPTRDTLAIVISGDGGWRDLDRSVAEALQKAGVPTVGLDALRYFWSARTPEATAADLNRIAATYLARWGVHHILLAGYSFGASVLPGAYDALPAAMRERVTQISLLAPAEAADWEISVNGWLGGASSAAKPIGPALAKIPAPRLQCFYGAEEDDSACPALAATGAEVVRTAGGHHFDGDYAAIATRMLAGLDQRLGSGTAKTD